MLLGCWFAHDMFLFKKNVYITEFEADKHCDPTR